MVGVPTLGYPSKKAAIWALLDEGKPVPEIADLCDTSEQAVYIESSAKRKFEQRTNLDASRWKAVRIYRAALDIIGEAYDVDPEQLHITLSRLRFADFNMLERAGLSSAPQNPASDGDDVTPEAPEPEELEPEEAPKPADEVTSPTGDLFTLYNPQTREYLMRSGKGTTRHKDIAYRGTREQASAARNASGHAFGMRIQPF